MVLIMSRSLLPAELDLNAEANTTANASSGSNIAISWKNTQQFGGVKLIKYGKPQNGEKSLLKDAEFALYDSNNRVVDGCGSLKTDSNGIITVTGLPYGTYFFKEIHAPAGYELNPDFSNGSGYRFQVNATTLNEGFLTLECVNQTTLGRVTVTKFTKYTQGETEKTTNLPGVQFGLYSDAAATQLIANAWTDSSGKCTFNNLEAGVYYVREISGLSGYKTNNTVYPVYVNRNSEGAPATWHYELSVENEPYEYRVKVLKKDETSGDVLPGAEFTLTGKSIFGKDYSIKKTTGADGIAEFTGLPYGEYVIKETGFPEGYAKVAKDITVVISNEAQEDNALAFETTAVNKRTRLTVFKNDSATLQPLEGAQFKIKDKSSGRYITASNEGSGRYVYTGTADSKDTATTFRTVMTDGSASFLVEKLPIGDDYDLEEIAAPNGYLDQQTPIPFQIRKDTQSVTVGNTLVRGDLRIIKTDGSGKVLPGIRFKLSNATGDVTVKKVSDGQYSFDPNGDLIEMETIADGSLRVTGLTLGIYTLVETNTPSGLVNAGEITVRVDQEQHEKEIFLNVINGLNNQAVSFLKIDNTGAPLQGAMFKLKLLDAVGNAFAGADGTSYYATSGYDGMVTFQNIPSGVYELSEYTAPAGKVLSTQTYYVRVGVEPQQVSQEILNQYQELPVDHKWVNDDIQITTTVKKVSEDGVTFAPGAEFKILNEEKEAVSFVIHATQTTAESFVVNQPEGVEIELPVGVYYLQEIKGADDHILNPEPQMFTVRESGSNVVIMKNTRYRGSLVIRKADENGAPLAGAEFTGYLRSEYEEKGTAAEVQFHAVVDAKGVARVESLVAGEYIVLETKVPNGYIGDAAGKLAHITNVGAEGGKEILLDFVNTRAQYWIEITKEDIGDAETVLAGATFSVSGENFYQEVTTDETGSVSIEVPRPGVYTVTEIKAPDGYTIDTNPATVTVTEQTTTTPTRASFVSRDYPTKLILNKVDENGDALDGAVFNILRGEELLYFTGGNGSYTAASRDAEGASADLTTVNGVLEVRKLPLGEYVLKEVSMPDGYMNLGDMIIRVSATDDHENHVMAKNIPYERGVAICKVTEDGIRLAGATFALCQENGTELAREVTSASGYAIFRDLPMGSYYIREKAAPDGYQLMDEKITFQIDADGNLVSDHPFRNMGNEEMPFFVLEFVNQPEEYELKILKVSATDPDTRLEHAQFRLIGNGRTETVTTDADGIAAFKLTVGEYMLTEVKAPDGYVADASSHHILVTSTEIKVDGEVLTGDTLTYTVENIPENFRMVLVKEDSMTGKWLAGAGFMIYDDAQNVVHSLVTDDNGMSNEITMAPGVYYIQETVAPIGYLRPMATWKVEITEDGDISCDKTANASYSAQQRLLTLTLTNQRTKGNLMIYKHDADDKTVALEGARFRLFDEAGNAVKFTVKNGIYHADTSGTVNSVTTGVDGKICIEELPIGEYKLYELEAPVGYEVQADTPILVKLTHAEEELRVDVGNERARRVVRLIKEDPDGVKLIGAEFALYNTDGSAPVFMEKGTTGSDGIVEFQVTFGSYQIFETAAPVGHERIQEPVATFTFDEDTKEEETFTFTVINEKTRYALEVYKHEKGNPAKGLQGAQFAVTNSLGFTKVITTGADGIARLDNILYDDYTIREIKAPAGYYLTDQTYTVKRTDLEHGTVLRYEFSNEPVIGAIYLKKVDHLNRDKILNAEFTVTDRNGNVLSWEKTATGYRVSANGTQKIRAGHVKLENIPMGVYTIRETAAPDGYVVLEESREFSITEKNALAEIEIEITNLERMTAVGVVKMDADKLSVRLEGAEFTLYPLTDGREGTAIKTVTTDKNGMAIFSDLTMGTYALRL